MSVRGFSVNGCTVGRSRLVPLSKPGEGPRQRQDRCGFLWVGFSPDQRDGLIPNQLGNQAVLPVVLGLHCLVDFVDLGIGEERVHRLPGLLQPGLCFLGMPQAVVSHRQEKSVGDQVRMGSLA